MLSIYNLFFFLNLFIFGGKWIGSVEGILSIVFGGEDSNILAPYIYIFKGTLTIFPEVKTHRGLDLKRNVLSVISQLV